MEIRIEPYTLKVNSNSNSNSNPCFCKVKDVME